MRPQEAFESPSSWTMERRWSYWSLITHHGEKQNSKRPHAVLQWHGRPGRESRARMRGPPRWRSTMRSSFTFIHLEASSTKPPAFPVELYWGSIPGDESIGYLVNHQGIERWAKWTM